MRVPEAATGWPIPTAPPLTLTMSWEKPSFREQATDMVAKASLISTRSTSETSRPASCSALGTAMVGARPGPGRLDPARVPGADRGQDFHAVGIGVVAIDHHDGGSAVGDPRRVPGRDLPVGPGEGGERGQFLQCGVTTRMLVHADRGRLAAPDRDGDRHDLAGEAAVVGRRGGPEVGVIRPVVRLLPGDAALHGPCSLPP